MVNDIEAPAAIFSPLAADFDVLANSIPQLAWMARPDGHIFWYNNRWYDYTGTTLAEMEGWGWRKVHHPDHVDNVVERLTHAFTTGEPWEDTFPLRGADGAYRWFLSRAIPVRADDGTIQRWIGTNTDITEQKHAAAQHQLLMREVDHRAKNALAVAQAVVNLTRAETIESYKEAVFGRIAALSRAHSLLAAERWRGVPLRRLVDAELAPFVGGGQGSRDDRITVNGPSVMTEPAIAQSLALILHELVTNAAKHGALANGAGRLAVHWAHGDEETVEIIWRETGVSLAGAPSESGFGTTLLEKIGAGIVRGGLVREWTDDGVVVTIRFAHLAQKGTPALSASEGSVVGTIAPASGPAAAEAPARASILVAEDEAFTALDLEARLSAAGYRVLGPVASVAEARNVLATARPDLALLDANLGGETTYALALDLKALGVPVTFCTGYEALHALPEALTECPIVHKPFEDRKLFAALDGDRR